MHQSRELARGCVEGEPQPPPIDSGRGQDTEEMLIQVRVTAVPKSDLKARAPTKDKVAISQAHTVGKIAIKSVRLDRGISQLGDANDRPCIAEGGERDLIVVSATASDPEFVLAEAKFLLNPNRLNVALSRSRKKLIVIGSTTIFRLVPPDMEIFESALLWKRLRYEFSAEVLWEGEVEGVPVRVSGRRTEGPDKVE